MKTSHLLALLPLLALAPACSESDAKTKDLLGEAGQSVKEIDTSKLTPEVMQTSVTELAGDITKQLQKVTDEASATDVRAKLEPMIDQLSQLKDQLGDKLPSLDAINAAVDGLKLKLAGNESVLKILEPVLQKLQALVQ